MKSDAHIGYEARTDRESSRAIVQELLAIRRKNRECEKVIPSTPNVVNRILIETLPIHQEKCNKNRNPAISEYQPSNKTSRLNNRPKIEDRLIQYKEDVEKKLVNKRLVKQNTEIIGLRDKPLISPVSRLMASKKMPLLRRMQSMEADRVMKRMQCIRDKFEHGLDMFSPKARFYF